MKWNDLKQFCNKLPESELNKDVILSTEDDVIRDIDAEVLTEDYVYHEDYPDEGCFPRSELDKNDPDYDLYEITYPKGMAILWGGFALAIDYF